MSSGEYLFEIERPHRVGRLTVSGDVGGDTKIAIKNCIEYVSMDLSTSDLDTLIMFLQDAREYGREVVNE